VTKARKARGLAGLGFAGNGRNVRMGEG
jgi:hypothetical protein